MRAIPIPAFSSAAIDTLRVTGAAVGKSSAAGKTPRPGAVPAISAADALHEATYRHVVRAALTLEPVLLLAESRFQALTAAARSELPLLALRTGEAVVKALAQRSKILAAGTLYPTMSEDLRRLLPPEFPANTSPLQLAQLPRDLRAVETRAERAAVHRAKDADKARLLAPFEGWEARVPVQNQEAYRASLGEYRVSIFAQELGTAQPVSAQRLRALETVSG